MPCYHPLMAMKYGKDIKIIGSHYVNIDQDVPPYLEKYWNGHSPGERGEYLKLPCGQCIGCRLDYARQWSNRLVMESLEHPEESNWFLTFTYDDDHLPFSETTGIPTLRPQDMTNALKRLRKHFEYYYGMHGIRYYLCGEYGDHTARPHYHACVFGLHCDSGKVVGHNGQGHPFFDAPEIRKCWTDEYGQPIGVMAIGRFNWQTANYTARYVTKKLKGEKSEDYQRAGIEPVYCRMSRRPGIALNYFNNNWVDIYRDDNIVLPANESNPNVCKPPKYFDNKLADIDEELFNKIKAQRIKVAKDSQKFKLQQTDLNEEEYLAIQEEDVLTRTKLLLDRSLKVLT